MYCMCMHVCEICGCYSLLFLPMQVCNHPDLFEPRPILSPLRMAALEFYTASLVLRATEYNPFEVGGIN